MSNLLSEQESFYTQFEPSLKNRFTLYIDGIPSWICKKVTRPKLTQEPKELPHINVSYYVKGKSKWGPMTFTLYDPIVPSGAQAVMEWVRLGHESITGRDGYADFYKKDLTFHGLGPVNDVVQEWIIKGAILTEVDFGEGDWSSDDPNEITCTVQMDFALLNF